MFELCAKKDADYDKVKEAFLSNNGMPDEYPDVSKDPQRIWRSMFI